MILIRLTLFLALGILSVRLFGELPGWALLPFPALSLLLLLPGKITGRFPKLIPLCLLALSVACAGAWLMLARGQAPGNSVENLIDQSHLLEMEALDYSKKTQYGQKVLARVHRAGTNRAEVTGGILLYLPDSLAKLRPGDCFRAQVRLRPLKSRYPAYLQYLRDRDIVASGNCSSLESLGQIEGWRGALAALRNGLNHKMAEQMPDRRIAGLAGAMLLGDRSELDQEIKGDFARAGLSHILAISGLHVGIVFAFFRMALSFLGATARGRKLQAGIALAGLLVYMLLTGCSPAVCRAVLMIATCEIGRLFYQQSRSLNNLALAALVLLVLDPRQLFQVGFQLSFAAVAGILVFAPVMQRAARERWGKWGSDALVRAACVCLAAQVFTAPLVAWHFGTFPSYFLFANLLLLPLVSFAVNLGAAGLFFCWVPGLGTALFGMLDFCLWLLVEVGNWFSRLPGASIEGFDLSQPGWAVLGLSTLLVLILWQTPLVWKRLKERSSHAPAQRAAA